MYPIRRAETKDISRILCLLTHVCELHHNIRPDIFKPNQTKYAAEELKTIITNELSPVFVYDDGEVLGYVFCQIQELKSHRIMVDRKILYIDDICVDEKERCQGIGSKLFSHVHDFAKQTGCQSIILNVWEGNDKAQWFYKHVGMKVLKTCMEMKLSDS